MKHTDIEDLTRAVILFRDKRDWAQFHNPKDVALSLVLEASELLEHFQWKSGDELAVYLREHHEEVGDELADILYWVLLFAHDQQIDLVTALSNKLDKNRAKYPVAKARGSSKKYSQLSDNANSPRF